MSVDTRLDALEWDVQAFLEETRRQVERIKVRQLHVISEVFEQQMVYSEQVWRKEHLGR